VDLSLTSAQLEVQAAAQGFARERVAPLAREMDEAGRMPLELLDEMARRGLLGGPLPRDYGGQGWDAVSLALCYEALGQVDSSVRGCMTVHTSLVSQCLAQWGSPEQKARYLPRLARGEMIGCYCLTEPQAGSDVASLQSRAVADGEDYVLNGEKIWITNGGIAHLALVFATADPAQGRKGLCAFVVETDWPGFERGPMPGRELGHRAADHAHIRFNNLRVPGTALLGQAGQGFKVAMSALDHGRLGVAAGALGVGQACLDACVDFARTRRQFGQRLGDFEMIQAVIADMAADIEAARLLVYRAAWLKDKGHRATREVSIAKLFATEAAVRAAGEAVLLHGGRGYSSEYPVERYYRDIKGLQIYEGTAHIQRIVIARDILGKEA
jgi:butyryl-CoA dehydrogenase